MNILIALGCITPNDDANSNIAKLLAAEMNRKGHKVTLLGTAFKNCPEEEEIDHVRYVRIIRTSSTREKHISASLSHTHGKKEWVKKALRYPDYLALMVFRHLRAKLVDVRELAYKSKIKKLMKREHFDRIIAITSPSHVLSAALKASEDIPVVWYQLDPNQSNHSIAYHGKHNLMDQEKGFYEKISLAVIPRLVYQENQHNELSAYTAKMREADFPNIRTMQKIAAADDVTFEPDRINLVFTGTFYEDIRDPRPLFELVSRFQNEKIVLHIIGGGCLEMIDDWVKQFPSRIIFHGYRSLDAAVNAMQAADILVNVDNTEKNMLPSKLNDYISTGKPVINLHPFPDTPAIAYMKPYKLSMNICTEHGISDDQVRTAEDFCTAMKGHTITFEEVLKDYYRATPEFVSNLLLGE